MGAQRKPANSAMLLLVFIIPSEVFWCEGGLTPLWHLFSLEKELYQRTKVQIIGVSKDPVEKQKVFVEKEKLTVGVFPDVHALSDIDREAHL